MPDTITPGMGHNLAPLPELLKEETTELSSRAAELLGAAERCRVENDETAGRATTLVKMLGDHAKLIDRQREDRKSPFLESGRQVDAHFKAIAAPLDSAKSTVLAMVDAYRREQSRKAEEERKRLEAEAQSKREEAEAALAVGTGSIEAEIEAQHHTTEAAGLELRAAAVAAPVIQSEYGTKAFGRKEWTHDIDDPAAAFKYLLKTDRSGMIGVLSVVVAKLVKVGIREIPGTRIYQIEKTVVR